MQDRFVDMLLQFHGVVKGALGQEQGSCIYFLEGMEWGGSYSEKRSMDIRKLKEKLERITDPRRQWGNLRHNLEGVTQQLSDGMHEMSVGAEQVNSALSQVNSISGENRESINSLAREVERFKVD
jgi:X-X-X-Leu-X-X-Gly heptad repeat protein